MRRCRAAAVLQWVTAAQTKTGLSLERLTFYRRMAGGLALAALAAALVAAARPLGVAGSATVWAWAAPLLLLWLTAPALARWLSLPPAREEAVPLSGAERRQLRLIARRTWRFFETFVGAEDHHLPPDNFQETPKPVVAHRTSPTNLGLYLLSVVAARDRGWIGVLDGVDRLEETLGTMGKLDRFRGHFYNWYDTRDVHPLDPRYVSTVDSGNLAGHLLALAEACRQLACRPPLGDCALAGVGDALAALRAAAPASAGRRTQTVTRRHLDEALAAVDAGLDAAPATPAEWAACLDGLAGGLRGVVDVASALVGEQRQGADAAAWGEVLAWAEAAQATVGSHLRDLDELLPWARSRLWRRSASPPSPWPHRLRPARAPPRRPPQGLSRPVSRRLSNARPPPPPRSPGAWRSWPGSPPTCSPTWSSPSSTIPSASCSRSAIASPRASSTPATTICWPPRRAWRASSPSPRTTCPRSTGSSSDGR